MGWIGWTSDQTLDTPIPHIELAHRGRRALLRQIFGTPETPDTSPPPAAPTLTPALFKAMFDR